MKRCKYKNERLKRKLEIQRKEIEQQATEHSISFSRMPEERNHLNETYNEDKRKMKRTMHENKKLMKELETQRKEIEQQAKEIEKRDAQLDFKSKQLLVLRELNTATRASGELNTVQGKREGAKNKSRRDKLKVQIDTNGLHKELDEKVSELDNEFNGKQTLLEKEQRSNHDLQGACKVTIEEIKKGDDEKPIDLIDEWGNGDIGGSGVERSAFEDMFPPIPPPEFLVDMCNDMPNNSSDLSSVLPVPNDEIADLDWLSTFDENSLSAGGITLDMDFSNNKDDFRRLCTSNPVSIRENNSSCSGGKTMPLSLDTDPVVPRPVRRKRPLSAIFNQQPTLNLVSPKSCTTNVQNSENIAESHPPCKSKINGNKQRKKKTKKKKLPPSLPSYSSDHDNLLQQQQQPGVANPRNACGMCYRSGGLFPEYRPAASPTFVASMHSNRHRKVLEMMKVKGTPDR
ncbi:hypothetical protein MKW94_027097 [Papaver nudicaule]|uniref:Uncharacterized protein n=1 Tax=Papaver nudicaule TaxID=74823 RepID=A0AA41VLQ2_PAPNU|nr:hypothetical protein [Papaver nudicaule]